jgi:hypothetical protein
MVCNRLYNVLCLIINNILVFYLLINIGILPRDGKNISFKDMSDKIRVTYNFAPSFCLFVPTYAANYLKKKYGKDTCDLDKLDLHNKGIEHDASLTRKLI